MFTNRIFWSMKSSLIPSWRSVAPPPLILVNSLISLLGFYTVPFYRLLKTTLILVWFHLQTFLQVTCDYTNTLWTKSYRDVRQIAPYCNKRSCMLFQRSLKGVSGRCPDAWQQHGRYNKKWEEAQMLTNKASWVMSRRRAPSLCMRLQQLQLTIFPVSEDSHELIRCTWGERAL
jgi:hypothetical protein